MANATGPFGLVPIRKIDGSPYSGAVERCVVLASDGTALFIGDPVKSDGAGSAGSTEFYPAGLPAVTKAGATDAIRGVVVKIEFDPDNLGQLYRSASTLRTVLVAPAADTVFLCREDSTGGALTVAQIGEFVDLANGSGSTITGVSGTLLDSSTSSVGGGAGVTYRVLGLHIKADNELGIRAVWEVTPVNSEFDGAVRAET